MYYQHGMLRTLWLRPFHIGAFKGRRTSLQGCIEAVTYIHFNTLHALPGGMTIIVIMIQHRRKE